MYFKYIMGVGRSWPSVEATYKEALPVRASSEGTREVNSFVNGEKLRAQASEGEEVQGLRNKKEREKATMSLCHL
jgi:hypothetical protein